MKKKYRPGTCLLALFFACVPAAWPQYSNGVGENDNPSLSGESSATPSTLTSQFSLTGKVLLPGGLPSQQPVAVQVVCDGRVVHGTYADSKGRFRLAMTRASSANPSEVHLLCSDGSGVSLDQCEVRAAGGQSGITAFSLANQRPSANVNVGTLHLAQNGTTPDQPQPEAVVQPGQSSAAKRHPAGARPQFPRCSSQSALAAAKRGISHLNAAEYVAASTALEESLKECPDQIALQLDLSRALAFQGRFDEAHRATDTFLDALPDSAAGLLSRAFVDFMAQQFARSVATLDQLLASNPQNVAALKLKANALYLSGEDQQAESTFITALEAAPGDAEVPYMLGRIYYQQNRFDHAIGQFQAVLRLDSQSHKAYDNLGLCYEALNDHDTAIRHYMTAIKMVYEDHPEYAWPYANLANLMLTRGENDKAFSLAAEAAKRDPNTARNFYLTGKALVALDKPELSERWLKRAAELDANYSEPRYLLGQVYRQSGRLDESREQLEEFQRLRKSAPKGRR